MARAKRASDDVYNARRRYRRQAERYQKQAQQSTGIKKARYEAQARNAIMNAIRTYQGGRPQGRVATTASELGVTQESLNVRSALRGAQAGRSGTVSRSQLQRLISQSFGALAGTNRPSRDQMAQQILSVDNIGSRFYGGLVDIWGQSEESRQHPNRAILEYFGVESIMDVLEQLEEQGIDIYSAQVNDDVYKSVQLKLQQYVLQNRKA